VSRLGKQASVRTIFLAPAILAIVSAAGLASALLGDGICDAASWIALATPLAVSLHFILRARRTRQDAG
jgi:hypothetical protein